MAGEVDLPPSALRLFDPAVGMTAVIPDILRGRAPSPGILGGPRVRRDEPLRLAGAPRPREPGRPSDAPAQPQTSPLGRGAGVAGGARPDAGDARGRRPRPHALRGHRGPAGLRHRLGRGVGRDRRRHQARPGDLRGAPAQGRRGDPHQGERRPRPGLVRGPARAGRRGGGDPRARPAGHRGLPRPPRGRRPVQGALPRRLHRPPHGGPGALRREGAPVVLRAQIPARRDVQRTDVHGLRRGSLQRLSKVRRSASGGPGRARGAQRPYVVSNPRRGTEIREPARRALGPGGFKRGHSCVADVLFHVSLPVDIRHNAKIQREQLALWPRSSSSEGPRHRSGGFLAAPSRSASSARAIRSRSLARATTQLVKAGAEVRRGDLGDAAAVDAAVAGTDVVFPRGRQGRVWGPYAEYHRSNVSAPRTSKLLPPPRRAQARLRARPAWSAAGT